LVQINFLLVINTNLPPILHRFRDIAFDRSKIAIIGYWLPLLRLIIPMAEFRTSYHRKWYRRFGLHFCRRTVRYIFNHFYAVRAESYWICWNNAK